MIRWELFCTFTPVVNLGQFLLSCTNPMTTDKRNPFIFHHCHKNQNVFKTSVKDYFEHVQSSGTSAGDTVILATVPRSFDNSSYVLPSMWLEVPQSSLSKFERPNNLRHRLPKQISALIPAIR